MEKILLVLLPVLLVAGCIGAESSTGLLGTPLAGEQAAPEAAADPRLPIGMTISVGDVASTYSIDVTVKSAQITKSYTAGGNTITAPGGKTFILVEAEIRNKRDIPIDAGRDKFFATGADMKDSYGSSYAGTDGLVGSAKLGNGDVIAGKAAFEVPENIQGPMVVYQFGADITVTNMVGWTIS